MCGARIPEPPAPTVTAGRASDQRLGPVYDMALGEDDLFAPHLAGPWQGMVMALLVVGILGLILLLSAGASLLQRMGAGGAGPAPPGGRTAVPTLAMGGPPVSAPSGTLLPTLFLPTLTPPPPPTNTPLPTATPGPCEQVVGEGDTLIMLAMRCGHHSLDVIDAIIDLNGLRSAESLQIGQRILIPWPTPTPGDMPDGEAEESTGDQEGGLPMLALGGEGPLPTPVSAVIPTATLQPGVTWYAVQPGDTILSVALQFEANVEILSQLNPEVTFSQCDFGMDSGGPNCIVNLYIGQRLRVPAPAPTPTLSPTPSGSETPTPTPTATFNAPALLSPGDRALFGAEEMVTLRWVSTGVLAEGEAYLVTVSDTIGGVVYSATTRETFFILPAEWQPTDGQRHSFTWDVAVGPTNGQGGLASVTYHTEPRMFYWDSR